MINQYNWFSLIKSPILLGSNIVNKRHAKTCSVFMREYNTLQFYSELILAYTILLHFWTLLLIFENSKLFPNFPSSHMPMNWNASVYSSGSEVFF